VSADVYFAKRAADTTSKVDIWRESFKRHLGSDGERALANGCLYACGSAGRGELGASSDLDLFVVKLEAGTRIDEVLAQAAVVRMMAEGGLEPPSNDGRFLKLHCVDDLESRLGGVADDPENTFTARMLLLLESRPFYGDAAYDALVQRVLRAYWRNADTHPTDYLPIVLVNDIVRYWRVLLLNYESKYEAKKGKLDARQRRIDSAGYSEKKAAGEQASLQRDCDALDREKPFASYKLSLARCMTCYSMIARLLVDAETRDAQNPHVSLEAAVRMVRSTPVARIQEVRDLSSRAGDATAATQANQLLAIYRRYLEVRELADTEVKGRLAEASFQRKLLDDAVEFGKAMFDLLQTLGAKSPLYRFVVV
jgi:hypothetical protein